MSSFLCRWFGIGCPPKPTPIPPTPTPIPPPPAVVNFYVEDAQGRAISGALLSAASSQGNWQGTTNSLGNFTATLTAGHYDITFSAVGFKDRLLPADIKDSGAINVGLEVNLPALPTRDEMLGVKISFQGLLVDTVQFGRLPWFEAALAWLSPQDRASVYAAKKAAGDTHCIVFLPGGPPLYDEPNQPYSADRFGPLDWTAGDTKLDPQFDALLREVIGQGFKVLLFLDGDAPENYGRGMKQLDLLKEDADFSSILYKYCVIVPGWDGIFYGWSPEQIVDWGLKGRALFPDGYLGLEYSTGHIPVGEGGEDYKPRTGDPHSNPGRMEDFDLIIGEFDNNLHQDSCWQILNRLEAHYVRPSDQPSGDDPARVYYLGTPNPRGRFYHLWFEAGEYEFVRGGCSPGSVQHVKDNQAYARSMGCEFLSNFDLI